MHIYSQDSVSLLCPLAKHLPQVWVHSWLSVNAAGIVLPSMRSWTVALLDFIGKFQKNQGSLEEAKLGRWFPNMGSCTRVRRPSSFRCSSVKWENIRKSFCKPKFFFYKSTFCNLKDFPWFLRIIFWPFGGCGGHKDLSFYDVMAVNNSCFSFWMAFLGRKKTVGKL